MMALENLMEITNDIETGFLASKTVSVLKKSQPVLETDEKIIRESLELIKIVKEGREQANTGKIGGDPVQAANAYSLSLTALLQSDRNANEEFENYIKKVHSQLEDILVKKRVAKTKVKEARRFFEILLNYSIKLSGRRFYDKIEENEWII